jgi:hypothetical protein
MKNCKVKKEWIDVEMEHAHNFPKHLRKKIAEEIACDHIKELGNRYYPELLKMERRLKHG